MEDIRKEHMLFKPTFSLVSVHTHVFTDQMVPPSVRAEWVPANCEPFTPIKLSHT